MGFGSFLAGAGNFLLEAGAAAVKEGIEKNERIIRLKVEYEALSSDDLMARFETNEGERKEAIGSVLKDRGYSDYAVPLLTNGK